jgi:hypothetical protein
VPTSFHRRLVRSFPLDKAVAGASGRRASESSTERSFSCKTDVLSCHLWQRPWPSPRDRGEVGGHLAFYAGWPKAPYSAAPGPRGSDRAPDRNVDVLSLTDGRHIRRVCRIGALALANNLTKQRNGIGSAARRSGKPTGCDADRARSGRLERTARHYGGEKHRLMAYRVNGVSPGRSPGLMFESILELFGRNAWAVQKSHLGDVPHVCLPLLRKVTKSKR